MLENREVCEPQISKKKIFASLLFVPGVYLMIIVSTLLIVLIGCGLILFINYLINKFVGEMGFANLAIYLLAALPFFGILIGLISSVIAIVSTLFRTKHFEPAILINHSDHPKLHNLINELSKQMNTKMPDSIILHIKSNFFVSNGKIRVFNGVAKGRILSISLPLLNVLSINELRAILAHEFAHFTGRDLFYSRIVLPVYKGAATYLDYISSVFNYNGRHLGIISVPMILPNLLMKYYLRIFHKYNMSMSRDREYRADYIATLICGNEIVKEALCKIVSHGDVYDRLIDEHMSEKIVHGFEFENYFNHYREYIGDYTKYIDESLVEALKANEDEYHSHPSFLNRILNLPNVETKYDENEKSLELINHLGYIEVNMTKQYNYYLYQHLAGSSFMYE